MNESRVASRYAKSLLELSIEQKVVEDVYNDMALFAGIAEQNPQFARILKNPIIPHERKRNIIQALFKDKVSKLTTSFVDLIVRRHREEYLHLVAKEFVVQYKTYKGIQSAVITSAVPLTDTQLENFISIVKKISGKSKVDISTRIDESIIGGFVLQVGDRQVDQSVRSKLNSLRHNFKDNPYIAKY
jgi:F-type H+-transporting ATPase subunit delta